MRPKRRRGPARPADFRLSILRRGAVGVKQNVVKKGFDFSRTVLVACLASLVCVSPKEGEYRAIYPARSCVSRAIRSFRGSRVNTFNAEGYPPTLPTNGPTEEVGDVRAVDLLCFERIAIYTRRTNARGLIIPPPRGPIYRGGYSGRRRRRRKIRLATWTHHRGKRTPPSANPQETQAADTYA